MKRNTKKPHFSPWQDKIVGMNKAKEPSKGEARIIVFLNSEKLKFIREYAIKTKKPDGKDSLLIFDFYLPEYKLFIEYDGEYHFQPIYGKQQLDAVTNRDYRKVTYCASNKLHLLKIRYTDFENIEKLICGRLDRIAPLV